VNVGHSRIQECSCDMTTSHSVPLHRLQGLRLADVAPCFVQGINHEFRETDYQAKSSMSDMGLFPVIKAWALPNEKGRHGMVTQRLGNVLPHLPRWPAFRDGLGGSLNRENLDGQTDSAFSALRWSIWTPNDTLHAPHSGSLSLSSSLIHKTTL